jgi:hypothetical protein
VKGSDHWILFLNRKVNTVESALDTRVDDGMRSGFPRDSRDFQVRFILFQIAHIGNNGRNTRIFRAHEQAF